MISKIDLGECLRDSPKFRLVIVVFVIVFVKYVFFYRNVLNDEETSVDHLEHKLDKILKMCGAMVDTGKTYVAQQRYILINFTTK